MQRGKNSLGTEDPGDRRHTDCPSRGDVRGGVRHDVPIMPHRLYGAAELDQKHPPIQAVEVEEEDEVLEDELVERGEEIARGIVQDAQTFGRRRVEKAVERPD